jgi:hypothetical protein
MPRVFSGEFCRRRQFSIVLPIILYHGRQRWETRPFHVYLSGETELFARFVPGFEYLLVDLSTIPDKEIMMLFANNPAVNLWLLIQKYIYTPKTLTENLDSFFGPHIVYFTTEEGLRFLECLCRYIFYAAPLDPDLILRSLPMLPDRAREVVMTTAEKLMKQGKQEGIQERKVEDTRRMIARGYPLEDICETGVEVGGISLE